MKYLIFLSFFLISCNSFKVIQSVYYKVSPGIQGEKSYNEIKVCINSEKKIKINKNILVNNLACNITNISSKGTFYDTNKILPAGNYTIIIAMENVNPIENIIITINSKKVLLKPVKENDLNKK
jgi:hypothetical protein